MSDVPYFPILKSPKREGRTCWRALDETREKTSRLSCGRKAVMIKISSGGRDNMIGGMKAVELGQYDGYSSSQDHMIPCGIYFEIFC
jgi:hypothetical protein